MQSNVHVNVVEPPSTGLEVVLGSTSSAITSRSIITAKNPSGTYANVLRGTMGGLAVDLDGLTGINFSQSSVTASVTQIMSSAFALRRSITFVNPSTSARSIAIGTSATLTFTTNSTVLGPGSGITFDIGPGIVNWYAISETGTQRVCVTEVS